MQDPLRLVLEERGYPRLLYGRLLHRLLTEDPEYRAAMPARIERALETELTPGFLAALAARYEAEATELGLEDRQFLGALRDFFARRPEELRSEAGGLLNAP
jgi:hypothetical protein